LTLQNSLPWNTSQVAFKANRRLRESEQLNLNWKVENSIQQTVTVKTNGATGVHPIKVIVWWSSGP